jgi:hypothetical protein
MLGFDIMKEMNVPVFFDVTRKLVVVLILRVVAVLKSRL